MEENLVKKIYQLSVRLYYEVADDNMKRRGHPGVMGSNSDEIWDERIGVIEGTIRTLKDVSNKLKQLNGTQQ